MAQSETSRRIATPKGCGTRSLNVYVWTLPETLMQIPYGYLVKDADVPCGAGNRRTKPEWRFVWLCEHCAEREGMIW